MITYWFVVGKATNKSNENIMISTIIQIYDENMSYYKKHRNVAYHFDECIAALEKQGFTNILITTFERKD